MKQAGLFQTPPASVPVDERPMRACEGCEFIREPGEPRFKALGLWRCNWDGPATFRSTMRADGELRRCDYGYR